MRVVCRHGHFAFYPRRASDIARFCYNFATNLVRENDYYTFPALVGLEKYSLEGKPYLDLPAVITFEASHAWEVMRANNFVFEVASQKMISKTAVTTSIKAPLVGYFFISPTPLIQPGSRNEAQQILSYDGEYMDDLVQLRVTEFGYE